MSLRDKAITEYHQMLAADAGLSAGIFQNLRATMRSKLLVYGDRPIGVALRPHFLERKQFELLAKRAELVASALEKVAAAAVESPAVMDEIGLTPLEAKLALINPGFSGSAITSRMDGFVHGNQIKFVEYNAENPSSLSDQEGLNRLLFALPEMLAFAQRHRLRQFSPVETLLEALLATYWEWGGKDIPRVAIIDWHDVPTANEFVLLRDHFVSHGVQTIICSPHSLEYAGGKLWCGDFPIDVAYKRIIIHELLAHYDERHPLVQAYMHRDVCLVNPFRCKIMHKKAGFELLTDEARQSWFTTEERKAIRDSVPWTRRLHARRTTYRGDNVELVKFVRQERARLIIKPNDDYGGRGIYIGSRLREKEWDAAIETALAEDYVVQEAVDLYPEEFPVFDEKEWKLQPMFVDTNPFLFRGKVCGAMVRLSSSPVVNVTSGGGETGFFVLEPET
jgi:glutathionylspermidine synthase